MGESNTDHFYSRLPVNEIALADLLSEEHLFYPVPANWHIVITDIRRSTLALEKGLHETVNLLAAGSIVAVLNIALKAGITIPFFFGGDGASFLLPDSLLDTSIRALLEHQANTLRNFDLDLRVGSLPVAAVYEKGYRLTVSKLRTSKSFIIPISLGDGLSYAERIIKGKDYLLSPPSLPGEGLDLTGMQCRWDKVKPPQNDDEVVSLLVVARDAGHQAASFRKVIVELDTIYGNLEKRRPISLVKLRLNGSLQKLALEMKTKFGGMKPFYLAKSWLTALFARWYFNTRTGLSYLGQLVEMSDTLVIDGRINTVISGTAKQREQLEAALTRLEEEGDILFGLYISKESVISCYVRNLNEDHIHFVDGAEGGYTRAASVLKRKFSPLTPAN
jgi:Protein of unknown function (DUF3095)